MDLYKGYIPIFDCQYEREIAKVNPMGVGSGLVPRDYSAAPHNKFYQSYGITPKELVTIKRTDWDAYFDEQEETESSLEHKFLRGGKPAFQHLDQDGDGHCWGYSWGGAAMLWYLRHGAEVPRINPHFFAAYLRRFNGGWCGASMQVGIEVGCPEEGNGPGQWPKWSNDTSRINKTVLDAAAKHKVTAAVYDLAKPVYGQTLMEEQIATLGFTNTPAQLDFNEMAHSMAFVRWVRVERGLWCPLILNSWPNWGHYGLGVLRNMDADGGVATLEMLPR